MASGGGAESVGSTGHKPYFCYQCLQTVSISISASSSSELLCPLCHDGFIEESDNHNPNPNPSPNPNSFFSDPLSPSPFGISGFPFVFSSSSSSSNVFDLSTSSSSSPSLSFSSPHDLSSLFGPPSRPSHTDPDADPDAFNPLLFLQNYLHTLMAGGANIQFVIENGNGTGSASALPANVGDYFLGPGLEQLIQQLAENDPNRYGTPPAAKSAVDSLPDIAASDKLLASDSAQCAVCMDAFELGARAKQMPCKHIFHPNCILPWLELHNSCPVCRYELPTDDPDYEQRRRGSVARAGNQLGRSAGSGSSGGDAGDLGGMGTLERRFRISLPWPFRGFGSSDSGDGGGNDVGGSDGERNRSSGNRGSGPETRQEDLD